MKKRNRKLRKVLLVACSALILVCISVGATIAYLTDHESVTNTFTVGKVGLTLDEAPVNENGDVIDGDRRQNNEYHLIPGETYTKDPTITINGDSENCYVVAKIEVTGMQAANNPMLYDGGFIGFGGVVTGGVFNKEYGEPSVEGNTLTMTSTDDKITLTQTVNTPGESYTFMVYFKDPHAANTELALFENLVIPGEWTNNEIAALQGMKMNITAYAVQAAGMDDVFVAYKAGSDANWKA